MNKAVLIILGILLTILSRTNIIVDGNTNVYVEKSLNGIDVINISTPSIKGISHSTFKDFNVSEKGAVINNAKNIAKSNIAGIINGNKNINNIRAKLALLDVTGTEESKLKGALEALSRDNLDVILSNPNGITLDGASFLNIHNMILTTSKINLNQKDTVSYSKPKGNIKSLKEINTKNNLEIIANTFFSNSDIHAKDISITTYAGEQGIEISADILGSIYADVVKIVATKSGIGVNSIKANNVSLESKTQANIESIKTDNLDIKVEEDFTNKDKIVANNNLNIEAKNIINDDNVLVSDNISLNAKENIFNINGAIIHADNNLSIKSKNIDNIGKVLSYGTNKRKWISANKEIFDEDNISIWKKSVSDTSGSFNWFRFSDTNYAKEKALNQFYKNKHKISETKVIKEIIKKKVIDTKTNKEIEIEEEIEKIIEPEFIESSEKGKITFDKYSYMLKKYFEEYRSIHKREMSIDNDYVGSHTIDEKDGVNTLKSFVESIGKETKFSIISANRLNISNKDILNNRDAHILTNEKSTINTKELNNASSISSESLKLQDGYERLSFSGDRTCWGLGLLFCTIDHSLTYTRDLKDGKDVYIKALVSNISGDLQINAESVNFKAYKEDESKQLLRKENQIYTNEKEKIEIPEKEIDVKKFDISSKEYLKSKYFLDNIGYNKDRYIQNEFKNLKYKSLDKSTIVINASNLSIKDQELLFENLKLSANNIIIEGSKIETKDLMLKADNIKISSIKEKEENNEKYIFNRALFRSSYLDKKEINEKYISSNILSDNILIDSKNTNILGSNIKSKILKANNLSINSNILNNEYIDNRKVFLKRNNLKIQYDDIHKSNILSDKLNVDNLKVKGSNLEVNTLESNNLEISGSKLNIKLKNRNSRFNFIDGNTLFSHKVSRKENTYEKIEKSNVLTKEKASIDKLNILSSNVILNDAKINSLNIKSQELNNKENENDYRSGLKVGLGINLNIQNQNLKSNSKVYENTNLILTGNTVIEKELDVTNTNLNYDNLIVNAKDVNFRAIKDIEYKKENISKFNLGIKLNVDSPILNDAITLGRGFKNILEGSLDKAVSNVANGYTGAINHLSSNIKVNKDLKLEKDISGYLSTSLGLSLNISNKNILTHNENVKENTLVGNKLVFNNNKEVNYTSTVLKDSNIEYNNTRSIRKDVLKAENKKNITDISLNLGIGSSLDVKNFKFSPINVSLGLKASTDTRKENIVKLNKLINTNEKYKDVEEVSINGIEIKDSTLKGNIANLSIEKTKDELKRNKVGLGFDLSITATGIPTSLNLESEIINKRKEKVLNNDIDLSLLNIKNLIIKDEKANNHNIDIGFKVGTSGINARVNNYEVDLNKHVIDAIINPREFKDKQELAIKDIESTVKGIKSKIDNISKTTNDELTDISEEEKRSFIELSNYHLNAEYIVREINEKEAKSKKQRKELAEEIGFKDLKVLEKITEDNVKELPEGLKKRYYEIKQRDEELKVAVDNKGNVYTFGDLSELEFKKALARELGIHINGRITEEGKLLGATSGNIYSEYINEENASSEIEVLEKDSIDNIPEDIEIVSDLTNSGKALEHFTDNLIEINNKELLLDKKYILSSSDRIDKIVSAGGRLINAGGKLVIVYGLSVALDTLGYAAIPITSGLSLPISQGLKYIGYVIIGSQIVYIANETTAALQDFEEAISGEENKNKFDLRDINPKLYDAGSDLLDFASLGVLTIADNIPKDSKINENINRAKYKKVKKINNADKNNLQKYNNKAKENAIKKTESDKIFFKNKYSENLKRIDDIPDEVYEVIEHLDKNKFNPPRGVRGNREWRNKDKILPLEYKYREFDIQPKIKDRNKIRLVFGSDGSIYYSEDHYESFIKLK